jgi:hypothetical protein
LALMIAALAVGLVGTSAYVLYQSYPFSWPKAHVMAGSQFNVFMHSVKKSGNAVSISVTVRRANGTSVPYVGFWGQELHLPSGEVIGARLSVYGQDRWLERLGRTAVEIEAPLAGYSGPADLLIRFFVEGQTVECLLPLEVPE